LDRETAPILTRAASPPAFSAVFLQKETTVYWAVVTEDFRIWTIRGRFREFTEGGPHVERMNAKEMLMVRNLPE